MVRYHKHYIIRISYILLLCVIAKGVLAADEMSWPTTDDYWRSLRAAASSNYSGFDISLVLNTSYTYDPDERLHGGTVGFNIPIYSKKEKIQRRSNASDFLKKGAATIQKLETSIALKKISIEQSRFLKAKFQHEGVAAVSAYFDCLKQIAKLNAQILQYHREIQSLISPFKQVNQVNNETSLVQP